MTGQFFQIIHGILHSEIKKKNEYAAHKARHSSAYGRRLMGSLLKINSFKVNVMFSVSVIC